MKRKKLIQNLKKTIKDIERRINTPSFDSFGLFKDSANAEAKLYKAKTNALKTLALLKKGC